MILSTEQFDTAFKKLPRILREYVAEDELTEITEELGEKYSLHVDTIGAVYRETTNMLLGFISPQQFVGELKSVGVPPESVGAIVEELNTKVFIPLREKMKNAPPEEPSAEETESAPEPQSPVTPVSTPTPMPPVVLAAPAIPSPSSIAPTMPVAAPQPAPQPQPAPTPAIIPQSVPPQHIPATNAYQYVQPAVGPSATIAASQIVSAQNPPHARTMKEDMAMAQAAPVSQRPASQISAPAAPTLSPILVPASTPVTFIPPVAAVPQPAAELPQQHQVLPPQAFPQPQNISPAPMPSLSTQPSNRDALHDVLKQYGIDPYRERIEE
jgi:hypothetical protein